MAVRLALSPHRKSFSSARVHCGNSSAVFATIDLPGLPCGTSAPACEMPAMTAPDALASLRKDFSAALPAMFSTLPPGITMAEKSEGDTLDSGAFGTTG